MRCSQVSSISLGRALSAGKAPMMPALHCSITRSGLETMKSGAPTAGIESVSRSKAGRAMVRFLFHQFVGPALFQGALVGGARLDAVEEAGKLGHLPHQRCAGRRRLERETHLDVGGAEIG